VILTDVPSTAAGPVAGTGDDGPRRRYDTASLLDVAVQLFTERGYDGTSMGDLAQASGLSKSSLYHHFSSREQLLRAALDRAVEPLFAVVDEPGARTGRAIERLEYVVRREVEVLVDQLPAVTLLLRVHGNTPTERWALERRREFDRIVADLVAAAADDGDVRTDVRASVVSRLLFGMINSLVEWYRPGPGGVGAGRGTSARTVTAQELADAVVRLAFDGLRR
jgi:AcrR family transcriptional regulator